MPRGARVLVDGGYYHIVTRGIDRRRLFRYSQDYWCFLDIVKRHLIKFQLSIIHYCLMPNHLHLLIHTPKAAELPVFMQITLQVYANYYRKKYRSTGFIFQNRYKSRLIDKNSYLLECGRYIERNPLRAKITANLLEYPWSSFPFYAKGGCDGIIRTDNPLFLEFALEEAERRKHYTEYILQERPYEAIVDTAFRIR